MLFVRRTNVALTIDTIPDAILLVTILFTVVAVIRVTSRGAAGLASIAVAVAVHVTAAARRETGAVRSRGRRRGAATRGSEARRRAVGFTAGSLLGVELMEELAFPVVDVGVENGEVFVEGVGGVSSDLFLEDERASVVLAISGARGGTEETSARVLAELHQFVGLVENLGGGFLVVLVLQVLHEVELSVLFFDLFFRFGNTNHAATVCGLTA